MKKHLLSSFLLAVTATAFAQQTFQINTSGFQFVPATVTITEGDTIEFAQTGSHPAVEVSLNTWNANGNTSNGGFSMASNGTKIKFNTAGTYYYVCNNHFAMPMKGQIVVQAANGIEENQSNVALAAYPTPVIENLNLVLDLEQAEMLSIEIYNIIGEQVYSKASSNYAAGKNTVAVDFSDLSNGAYFVKVIGKDEQYSIKILK